MDIYDVLLQSGLITGALVFYLVFFKKQQPNKGHYREVGWNYYLRLLFARYAVRRWKSQLKPTRLDELPRSDLQYEGWDSFAVRTTDSDGTALLLSIRKVCGRRPLAEIVVHVKLPDGTTYKLPQHPQTAVCAFENVEGGWSAAGLKFQVLEERERYRFLYNGLLTRVEDGVTQHVKLNVVWGSATLPIRLPDDWSNKLAAEALAHESWRDHKWPYMLSKTEEGGWFQWGAAQGRFESFDEEGIVDKSVFLRTRGVKERRWSPRGYHGLRRSIDITAIASDGTAVQLRSLSYKNELTHCVFGFVRFPNYTTKAITATDLVMSDFCERPDGLPEMYTINVSTENGDLKLVLRINTDGGELLSEHQENYQQEVVYRTMHVDINCIPGTGILELGYEPSIVPTQTRASRVTPPRVLTWLTEKKAGEVSYCVPFEELGARCPMYVGGKGASLALLASMQKDEGYRVPPGFCLTTKALDKHLEINPHLLAAIREIEAANENYDEAIFKQLCKKASELFVTTEIKGDIRDEILVNMKELRIKATEEKLGPELRFAVRSSAVGEDSEELSAAGQNETILGCISDSDIIEGVQKCWASMFAFTSTYYRRQNGQPCLCGGGVVVQALVTPRAAGVMFTRHPAQGDPSKLLITANYGLGESVVSGAVEPDTIIVKRTINDELTIWKKELGSKSRRVKTEGSGIAMEDVPEEERNKACITDAEALKLAAMGVSQEELWGAGRDIEWAITENEIFLLQARPITSLDRWTEEELLFELDSPVMADDEITSFGNTGEVLPKALSPMSFDVVTTPLATGMDSLVGVDAVYDKSVVLTHNRVALSLYNTIYRKAPKELGVNIRMMDMAIHGHTVADEQILKTAHHRRPPHWYDTLQGMYIMIKGLTLSKRAANDSAKRSVVNFDIPTDNPEELFEALVESRRVMEPVSYDHAITSTASSCSQFVAMSIFLEGKSDFTPELCSEISILFSSGDVLSAEVPVALGKIVQKLEESGLAEEFRAQDPKNALQWLKDNAHDDIYIDVREFLEQHGYRAVMEFDILTKPWVLVPENMMKVLQNLHVTTDAAIHNKSNQEIVEALKTPEKSSTRKVLRWVLPLCHRTVRHREITKAHLVLVIHKIRLGFIRLGNLLVKKWYIPNPDLVFFFRKHELKAYLATRDPALLKKAMQRQQYHPGWCKLKFDELNTGWVNKLEPKAPNVMAGDLRISATSVCGGEVVARACVIKDLESEIGDLRSGDVLITHATDIGWSPYFPLLTGIVTELGGLISHGAVIAREYGLPCIVGAAGATDIFKTGDLVRLSGTRGIIEKVEVEEEPQENNEES